MSENTVPNPFSVLESLKRIQQIPQIKMKEFKTLQEEYFASEYYIRLKELIIDFEKDLNENEEVGLKLVNFGEAITIHVTTIGYYNPSIMTFTGTTNDGMIAKLVQDVTQLNFLLIKVPRTDSTRPRIGFVLQQRDNHNL